MDWVGWYRSQNGKDQIAAFSYSPGLSSLVSLHVPKKEVEHEILLETLPLAIGFVFVVVVLLPAALGVLYRAYSLALSDKEEFDARSSAVIEHALDGTITINDSGIIESVNPSVVDLFGYLMTELLGVNIDTLVPEVYGKEDRYLKTLSRSSGGNVIDSG